MMQNRTYLDIPYDQLDTLKKTIPTLTFDKEEVLWFVTELSDQAKNYLPVMPINHAPQEEQWIAVMKEVGFTLDKPLVMDGKVHRVRVSNDKSGETSGAYSITQSDKGWYGFYQNHKTTDAIKFTSKITTEHDRKMVRALELNEKTDNLARINHYYFETLPTEENIQHPYLDKKQVSAGEGVKVSHQNSLIIPLRNIENDLTGYQHIKEDGTKMLAKGAIKNGSFYAFGQLDNASKILLAEGYATAASIHQATGLPTVMAVDAGNLVHVGKSLHEKFPNAQLIYCADNDALAKVNKGIEKANEAASLTKGLVVIPEFTEQEQTQKNTDWNDYMALGHDIKSAINQQIAIQEKNKQADEVTQTPEIEPIAEVEVPTIPETAQESLPLEADEKQETATQAQVDTAVVEAKTPTSEPTKSQQTTIDNAVVGTVPVENGFIFEPNEQTFSEFAKTGDINLDELTQRIKHSFDKEEVIYFVDTQKAFIDKGNRFVMASPEASQSEEKILAALLMAKHTGKNPIEITGDEDFIKKSIETLALYNDKLNLQMKLEHQQKMLDEAIFNLKVVEMPEDKPFQGKIMQVIEGEEGQPDKIRLRTKEGFFNFEFNGLIEKLKDEGLKEGDIATLTSHDKKVVVEAAIPRDVLVADESERFISKELTRFSLDEFVQSQKSLYKNYGLSYPENIELVITPEGEPVTDLSTFNIEEMKTPVHQHQLNSMIKCTDKNGVIELELKQTEQALQGIMLEGDKYVNVLGVINEGSINLFKVDEQGLESIGYGQAINKQPNSIFAFKVGDKSLFGSLVINDSDKEHIENFRKRLGFTVPHEAESSKENMADKPNSQAMRP